MTQRIVILPVQSDRDNTPYESAHEQTVETAESLGFTIVEPDDGNATAIVVVQMMDSAIIDDTLAKNPAVRWVQLPFRSEEHTSELQSRGHLVCRLLLEKKKNTCGISNPSVVGEL